MAGMSVAQTQFLQLSRSAAKRAGGEEGHLDMLHMLGSRLGGDIVGLGRLVCLAGRRKLHRKVKITARKQSADPRATAG